MFKKIIANIVIALYTSGDNIFSEGIINLFIGGIYEPKYEIPELKRRKINSFYKGGSEVDGLFGTNCRETPIYRSFRRQMEEDNTDFFLESYFNLHPHTPVNGTSYKIHNNESLNFYENETHKDMLSYRNLYFNPYYCEPESKIILPLHIKNFVNLIKSPNQNE